MQMSAVGKPFNKNTGHAVWNEQTNQSLHHVVFYSSLMKKMEVKLVYLILTQRLLKSIGKNLSDIKKVQNNKIV